jgi:integrase
MLEALEEQKVLHHDLGQPEYFFCTATGCRIQTRNLRYKIWLPALKKAGFNRRKMHQTRHSFATNSLSCGENPLWIAKVLGHRNTDMIIKVYSKYVENHNGSTDGHRFDNLYQVKKSNEG